MVKLKNRAICKTHIYTTPCLILLLAISCSTISPTEWPRWGGTTGDFKVSSVKLSNSWSNEGPLKLWSRELGEGYSGILVDHSKAYTMYRQAESEVLIAMDKKTGSTVWEFTYPATIKKKQDSTDKKYGLGPQSTPVLTKSSIVSIGWTGKMYCLRKDNGEVIWQHDLTEKYNATPMSRGFSSSPISYQNLVIALVGGAQHALMAFHQDTGEVLWSKHNFGRSHSSPIIINVNGSDQLVGLMDNEVVGVNPLTGELLWQFTHGLAGGLTVSTPSWGKDNTLVISTAYKGGTRALKLIKNDERTSVKELWFNKRMRLHHGNMIRLDDVVYSSSGDFGPAFFTALQVSTGDVLWKDRSFAKATFLYADKKFIVLDEGGTLALVKVSNDGPTILAKAKILEENCWTIPSLVGTTLYLRSRSRILAVALG